MIVSPYSNLINAKMIAGLVTAPSRTRVARLWMRRRTSAYDRLLVNFLKYIAMGIGGLFAFAGKSGDDIAPRGANTYLND